jgi:hypothetical protein
MKNTTKKTKKTAMAPRPPIIKPKPKKDKKKEMVKRGTKRGKA